MADEKLKILYLMQILLDETDKEHVLSATDLASRMDHLYHITCNRKTVYTDVEKLRSFGLKIEQVKGSNSGYYVAEREFELPELKLLVDAVQSAKFITTKKSDELIKKLESMVSIYEAKHLHRQVLITDRIKAMNESIYYNVDMLHEAINADRQIRFQYFQWTVSKKQELRRNGAWYQISPWCLMWDDENYYLVAFDGLKIKHYRVDKIIRLSISDIPREGKQQFREFNAAKYTKSLFGMYGGEMVHVTLEGQNHMVGALIDRFGKDISIIPLDSEHFRAHVDVITSPHFFGWVTSLGDGIRITGPDAVLEEMKSVARRISDTYL